MSVFTDCIERVRADMEAALAGLDPAPILSIGGTTTARPREFVVHEVPEDVSISDRSTSCMGGRGSYRIEFTVPCQVWCKTRGLIAAADELNGYVELFIAAIAADKTLGGHAVHAEPVVGRAGTAYENDRAMYLAACDLGVRVKAEINPLRTKE